MNRKGFLDEKTKGVQSFFMNLWRYKALVLMAVPGMLWMIFSFTYL